GPQEPLLAQQDGQRVRLLARAATRDPDLQRWVRSQDGHHLLANRREGGGLAEHVAHLDGEVLEQRGKGGRIAQDAFLQLRERFAPEAAQRQAEPALQRVGRVGAEVVLVLLVDGIDEEPHVDVEALRAHAASLTSASTRGRARAACPRRAASRCSRWRRRPGISPDRPSWPWR